MKTKPLLITLTVFLITLGGIFFAGCKHQASGDKENVIRFLNDFNRHAKAGDIDSLQQFFETDKNSKAITLLIKVLSGKTNLGGKAMPLFRTELNFTDNDITFTGNDLAKAFVKVNFSGDNVPVKLSAITFTIHKLSDGQFKIISVSADRFRRDYLAYQKKIAGKSLADKDVYEPITLAAFKTADQLKTRYDSVLWFEHVNKQTYFYVIKGVLNRNFYYPDSIPGKPTYKMGLISPSLKEIIPPAYDLIHNIGGTLNGFVEVELGKNRGLYDLNGKAVVPVIYDQIYPLNNDGDNLALLKKDADYFYLKKDLSITDKLTDFKIADELSKIKTFGSSFDLSDKSSKNIMEYNDRESTNCIVIPPSYLADWKIVPAYIDFQNPLRKRVQSMNEDGEGDVDMSISFTGTQKQDSSWFKSAFYSLVGNYLGARGGLYTEKKLVVVDKRTNRVMGFSAQTYYGRAEGGGYLSGACNENSLKAISDSLIEFKTTANIERAGIIEGPYYHYLQIKNGKLVPLPGKRIFGFTQYVKMNDSYLQGCYLLGAPNDRDSKGVRADNLPTSVLQYMKNEIYASYQYKFKSEQWNDAFNDQFERYNGGNLSNVDDSLTAIDKFNINFLVKKLSSTKIKTNTLAAK
ncbi:WG repeat-containing protein [Mucilaginibacter angelicae]|uniref:WG repeat-containing protein n=1 Tax=Mucilaginibacter angelicae TaxID=869718 RepID=A0ABV6LBA2_9SPHI